MAEYRYIELNQEIDTLKEATNFPDIPLFLICHTPNTMINEIEKYGGGLTELQPPKSMICGCL